MATMRATEGEPVRHELWRGLKLLLGTAFRADPWRTVGTLLEPLGRAFDYLVGFWLALMTNGLLEQRTDLIVWGAVGILVGTGLMWTVSLYGNDIRIVLAEKVGFAFDQEIARLTAALPGLEHFERADYQNRLELLRQQQGALGSSMNSLLNTANAVFGGLVVVAMLIVVHPLLLFLIVLVLPSILVSRQQQRWHRRAEEASAAPGRLARHLRRLAYDRAAGTEIRVFGLQDVIADRSREAWDRHRAPILAAQRKTELLSVVRECTYVLGMVGAIGFVFWRALTGQASVGDVVLAVYVCQRVQAAVIWPINGIANLGKVLRTAGRMLWLQDYAEAQAARRAGRRPAPSRIEHGITFDNVSFRYPGTDRWVLRNVSLTIPAGSVVAVVGENGAGKTTIVKLLTRMYEPTEGRILVDGVDLAEFDVEDWRRRLAAAFQDFARLEFSAQHTIGVGDVDRVDDEPGARTALDRAGGADVVPRLPDGLATQLGSSWEGGVDLSAGQWQKLALGRALMRERPLLLFFDEPTASLDAPTEHALFSRYAEASRAGAAVGAVTVLVSHRFSTVRSADLILVLDDQRVVQSGSHEELVRLGGLYAELYTLQERSYA